ncbi:hypothetical protein ACQKLX_10025 [Bosea sp. NPDC003192]|uniref:hypothetical protein n=1 Tax=Bosea sp. NPDC003192 TaxID=3390551 RepID=UPI003D028C73
MTQAVGFRLLAASREAASCQHLLRAFRTVLHIAGKAERRLISVARRDEIANLLLDLRPQLESCLPDGAEDATLILAAGAMLVGQWGEDAPALPPDLHLDCFDAVTIAANRLEIVHLQAGMAARGDVLKAQATKIRTHLGAPAPRAIH